ncbi:MAG: ferredoxin--NADP reductase [Myxococcota bacterium]
MPTFSMPRRIAQARRDVAMVAAGLRGVRPPVTVPRRARRRASALEARPLRVEAVVRETADAVTLRLSDLRGVPITFHPGQFLSLDVSVNGTRHRRAYSLSGALGAPPQITVKRIAGGLVSGALVDGSRAGDVLQGFGPSGRFGFEPDPAAARALLLVAGGSGITPLISVAESVLAMEPGSRVTLLYGNRRAEDVIFRRRLGAMVARFQDRFRVAHVLEETGGDLACTPGRLDAERVRERLQALGLGPELEVYLCGPTGMMKAAREALEAEGFARIHEERFQRPEARSTIGAELPRRTLSVSFARGETCDTVAVAPGQTLLEAGRAAGLALPFSCAMGGCGACRVRLTEGQVVMEEPNCLSPEEREAGQVLACVARPLSPAALELP